MASAGFGPIDEHVALDAGRLHRMLQLNVVAVAELCHRYGGEMKRRRAGRILNIASAAAYQPTPYFAAYGASKVFVLNFSEALAKELEDFGVGVSCLSPGPTDTAFFDGVDPRRVARDGVALIAAGRRSAAASGSCDDSAGRTARPGRPAARPAASREGRDVNAPDRSTRMLRAIPMPRFPLARRHDPSPPDAHTEPTPRHRRRRCSTSTCGAARGTAPGC